MFEGSIRVENRQITFVESQGTLDDHGEAIKREMDRLNEEHGGAAILSVSFSTTTRLDGNVQYSSILIVQVAAGR